MQIRIPKKPAKFFIRAKDKPLIQKTSRNEFLQVAKANKKISRIFGKDVFFVGRKRGELYIVPNAKIRKISKKGKTLNIRV